MGTTLYHDWFSCLGVSCVSQTLNRETLVTKRNGLNCRQKKNDCVSLECRSQWPRDLRRRSTATRLLRLWVRISPGAWMSVCCECCVLSGRSLCEESYRLWCVVVCDLHSVSQSPGRGPVPDPGINYTGPRQA